MTTRRTFLTAAAIATGAALTPFTRRQASAEPSPQITVYIAGQKIDREAVLQWEARRLQVAANRLSGNLPAALLGELNSLILRPAESTADVARERERLADVKLRMGEDAMRDLMTADIAITDPASEAAAAANEWSISSAVLCSTLGTANGFAEWFNARCDQNDQRAMLVAGPDHYLIRSSRPGVQEVIEVTGGAVMGARFVIDYADTANVPISRDLDHPFEASGWARTLDGTRIGAVRHQFRDDPAGGFSAKLAVAFPASMPPWMLSEHSWHLACEFSNWVTAYVHATNSEAAN